jgi:hypothetical protein
MLNKILIASALLILLSACGTQKNSESRTLSIVRHGDIIVETIETPLHEMPPSGDIQAEIKTSLSQQAQRSGELDSTSSKSPDRVLEDTVGDKIDTLNKIINAFADIMKRVLAPDTPLMKGNVIAEARPAQLEPMALQNSKYAGKSYHKIFKSLFGFTLVEVEYKITYAYGADNNGKGQYIPYVLFTPMKVVLDPLWNLEADALSLAPRNCGTLENPIAALEFNLGFKAKGISGTVMATDTFSLNAQTGELIADGRNFQD